jgi:hypothetical protein
MRSTIYLAMSSIAYALLHVQVSTTTRCPSPDVVLSTVYLTGRAITLLKYGARRALFQEKRKYPPHLMVLRQSVVDAFTKRKFSVENHGKKIVGKLISKYLETFVKA